MKQTRKMMGRTSFAQELRMNDSPIVVVNHLLCWVHYSYVWYILLIFLVYKTHSSPSCPLTYLFFSAKSQFIFLLPQFLCATSKIWQIILKIKKTFLHFGSLDH